MSGDKILLVKGTQGMGNRMLAAAGAILYARLSDRRLVFDWSDPTYSSDGADVFHRFFSPRSCDRAVEIPDTEDVVPRFWRGRLRESVSAATRESAGSKYADWALERRSHLDLSRLDYAETIAVFWAYTAPLRKLRPHLAACPELAALSDRELLRRIFREEFPLRPEIRARVREFRAAHLDGPTLGVHVRYGDYRVSLRAILTKIGELVRRDPSLRIFLATDNSEVLRTFERIHPNVVATPHWYGAPGVPLHRDPDCPDRTAGAIEALVDLYLLAECDYLVVDTSSTFAKVATLVGTRPASTVFDVRRRDHKQSWRRLRVLHALWMRTGLFSRMPRLIGRLVALTSR